MNACEGPPDDLRPIEFRDFLKKKSIDRKLKRQLVYVWHLNLKPTKDLALRPIHKCQNILDIFLGFLISTKLGKHKIKKSKNWTIFLLEKLFYNILVFRY